MAKRKQPEGCMCRVSFLGFKSHRQRKCVASVDDAVLYGRKQVDELRLVLAELDAERVGAAAGNGKPSVGADRLVPIEKLGVPFHVFDDLGNRRLFAGLFFEHFNVVGKNLDVFCVAHEVEHLAVAKPAVCLRYNVSTVAVSFSPPMSQVYECVPEIIPDAKPRVAGAQIGRSSQRRGRRALFLDGVVERLGHRCQILSVLAFKTSLSSVRLSVGRTTGWILACSVTVLTNALT